MHQSFSMVVLGLEGIITLLTIGGRHLTRTRVNSLEPRLFLMEMWATFQLCAYIGALKILTETDPSPQAYLAHIYIFTMLHFVQTLDENISNPASTLLFILRKGVSVRLGGLKMVAQFAGAFLARLYFNALYALGIKSLFSEPNSCGVYHRTTLLTAFCTEVGTSTTFHLTMLESQQQELRYRANVLAIAITSLVYAGLSLSLVLKSSWQQEWLYRKQLLAGKISKNISIPALFISPRLLGAACIVLPTSASLHLSNVGYVGRS